MSFPLARVLIGLLLVSSVWACLLVVHRNLCARMSGSGSRNCTLVLLLLACLVLLVYGGIEYAWAYESGGTYGTYEGRRRKPDQLKDDVAPGAPFGPATDPDPFG